jgi:hypothetical protein
MRTAIAPLLSFAAPTLPIFPDKNQPYARDAGWGTLFKLYEYAIRAAVWVHP